MDTTLSFKTSLIDMFDDLRSYSCVLTAGCEEEFKKFVENQINIFQKLKETEQEVKNLQKKISKLESQKNHINVQLKHVRSLFERELSQRKIAQLQKNSLERQIVLIKEVLSADVSMDKHTKEKLFLLSTCKENNYSSCEADCTVLSPSDLDTASDDLDTDPPTSKHVRKRRSLVRGKNSENKPSPKENESEEKELSHNDVFSSEFCSEHPKSVDAFHSISEPISNSFDMTATFHHTYRSDSEQYKFYKCDFNGNNTINIPGSISVGRYSTPGKLSRTHVFCTKTVIRTEKCYPCGHIIKFCKQALKCRDCRVTCHPECRDQCPVPCIPTSCTPKTSCMGTIMDYISSVPPMIPALIVHCVTEIESRGLKEIGLYRISGREREIKELKEKLLRGKAVPCLNQCDIHTLCGTVKEFLRSLKEPLVPRENWQEFVDAAENSNVPPSLRALNDYVLDLPQPNRDTLAYLVLHLKRISQAPECKMPTENLAKVFGPTIIGYSVCEPPDSSILKETKHQFKVLQQMLSMSTEFWESLLNFDTNEDTIFRTSPECISTPRFSRLGPIYSSLKPEAQAAQLGKSVLTPRNSRCGSLKPRKKQFFLSPLIK